MPTTATGFQNLFLFDTLSNSSVLVSHAANNPTMVSDRGGGPAFIASDDRTVVYLSSSRNLITGYQGNNYNVWLYDRLTGINTLVTHAAGLPTKSCNGSSAYMAMSNDGSVIVFSSDGSDLLSGFSGVSGVVNTYAFNTQTGVLQLISHSSAGPLVSGNGDSIPVVSGDGRWVGLTSVATDLIAGFVNGGPAGTNNAYLFDRLTNTMTLFSHKIGSLTTGGNSDCGAFFLSFDSGRVVWGGTATDVVAGAPNRNNEFVTDMTTGSVLLVDHIPNVPMQGGNGNGGGGVISQDGKWVILEADSDNLLPNQPDANRHIDLFLRNVDTDAIQCISRRQGLASATSNGPTYVTGQQPFQISGDGRFSVFGSDATNLVAGQVTTPSPQIYNVFLYDRQTGIQTLVSHAVNSATTTANGLSREMAISADGRFVAYSSFATDLASNFVDNNGGINAGGGGSDVYLFDRLTGINTLVSHQAGAINMGGNRPSGCGNSDVGETLALSGDGRYLAFRSQATDLVSGFVDGNGTGPNAYTGDDVFLYDRVTDVVTLVSHNFSSLITSGNSRSYEPHLSRDGRYVAYRTGATDLMAGGSGGSLYLYDRVTGNNVMVDHAAEGPLASPNGGSANPSISNDGRYVSFYSTSTNLVSGFVGASGQAYLYDRQTGLVELVSHLTGYPTAGADYFIQEESLSMSGDGQTLAYCSGASNLVAGFVDNNGTGTFGDADVYLYDRATGSTTLVTHSTQGTNIGSNGYNDSSALNGDGRFLFFETTAHNILPGYMDTLYKPDSAYIYDRKTGQLSMANHALGSTTTPGDNGAYQFGVVGSLSDDGSVIAFYTGSDDVVTNDGNGFPDLIAYITPPPQVASIQINDGSVQRSIIRSITVNFDEPVFFNGDPAGAFSLTRNGSVGSVQLAVGSFSNDPNGSITLTFSGALTQFGSLIDGKYTLTIDASKVSDIAALDGNGDGVAGDNWVSSDYQIYRLFGDANGDHHVDAVDFTAFKLAFNTNDITFDFDNNGFSDGLEFGRFRQNFGAMI